MTVLIDPASLAWDGQNQCWTWASPSGVRHYRADFSAEYDRPQQPRKSRPTRSASVHMLDRAGTWTSRPEQLVPALRAAGAVAAARYEQLAAARSEIQARRQAEQMEGVVTAAECLHCGAPAPVRGTPCRYCGTMPPG